MNLGVRRLRAYAGDFGEGPQQLGFDALRAVFQVPLRPFGAGLHGPAFYEFTPGLGRFACQPGDAVVRAARSVPLRAQVRQRGLHGLGESQHQGPARRHIDPGDFFQ